MYDFENLELEVFVPNDQNWNVSFLIPEFPYWQSLPIQSCTALMSAVPPTSVSITSVSRPRALMETKLTPIQEGRSEKWKSLPFLMNSTGFLDLLPPPSRDSSLARRLTCSCFLTTKWNTLALMDIRTTPLGVLGSPNPIKMVEETWHKQRNSYANISCTSKIINKQTNKHSTIRT